MLEMWKDFEPLGLCILAIVLKFVNRKKCFNGKMKGEINDTYLSKKAMW